MADKTQGNNIILQLGDIIKINAPNDTNIHDKDWYIEYIDKSEMVLTDQQQNKVTLFISKDGEFTNESIKNIELLRLFC